MKKIKLPKGISRMRDKYQAKVYDNSTKRMTHIGTYETVSEALYERGKYISKHPYIKTKPRGIAFDKSTNKYIAFINIGNKTIQIGRFNDMMEAIKYRLEFIDSLK